MPSQKRAARTPLSRRAATCLAESQWTSLWLWLLGLMTVSRLIGEGIDPLQRSVARARDAVRQTLRQDRPRRRRPRPEARGPQGQEGRLLAYDLSGPARLWEDVTDCGFWSWSRYGETILMSAELELAAWDVRGTKLWSRFVEPPWEYGVEGSDVAVDVMGEVTRLDLRSGRPV